LLQKKFDELRLTGKLPSPSGIGLRVLEITRGDDYLQEDLTKTIMADPALSGRIIKLANAADRDGLESVETVPHAAMRLGSKTVRTVALGFTLVSDNSRSSCKEFDANHYWSESLACAVAAHTIAREKKIFEAAEAFTCALLSDVGRLALANVHPEKYAELLKQHGAATGAQLAEFEKSEFDISHSEVTAALMEDWGLPEVFGKAVLAHKHADAPSEDESGRTWALVTLLRTGKAIAAVLTSNWEERDEAWLAHFSELGEAASVLGLELSELYRICDVVAREWVEWGKFVGVQTIEVPSFVETAAAVGDLATPEPAATQPAEPVEPPREIDSAQNDRTRILLIDDDQRILRLLQHQLRREGYDVITANSSKDGLKRAMELCPRIVITDWEMPEMTGIQLCQTLRLTEAGRKMYILIVTAREDDDQAVEAFGAGADDYVVKPFNPRILLARIRAGQRMILMRQQVEESERVRLRQVAELGILTRKLRAAAMTDALTELPNRRYAMTRLKQEWETSVRTGRPLSVVMVDIDHFKRVNDLYGHDAGDAVLRDTAQILKSKSRAGDVLCRLGGEEFLSIHVGCDLTSAEQCAERLRVAVETHEPSHHSFHESVTISLGVAQRTEGMTCIDDLLKAADEALYAAKGAGRNRLRSMIRPDDQGVA